MKQCLIAGWILTGAFLGTCASSPALAQETRSGAPPGGTPAVVTTRNGPGLAAQPVDPAKAAPTKPTAIEEILNLSRSGVAPEVIMAYVEHAPVVGFPTAAGIIALKEAGVPNEIALALMKRAGELNALPIPPQPAPGAAVGVAPANRNSLNPARYNLPDPESYDFWWYHYAYPRTLASANARLYGSYTPAGAYGSFGPSFSLGLYPPLAFRPHPWGGPYRGR